MWADAAVRAGRELTRLRHRAWTFRTLSAAASVLARPFAAACLACPFAAACVACAFAAACGGSAGQVRATVDQSPESLYPLAPGYAWSYDVDSGDGDSVLATVRVVSMRAGMAVVATGAGTEQRYELNASGIVRAGQGGHLLKAPIQLGASWQAGPDTSAHVASVSEQVHTPAGDFADCVRVDEHNAASGQRIATTYCPGVGPASVTTELDVRGQTLRVTARLRGYALEPTAAAAP